MSESKPKRDKETKAPRMEPYHREHHNYLLDEWDVDDYEDEELDD